MKKMKENILNEVKKSGRDTTNPSNETIGSTTNSSNETTCAINSSSNETTSVTNTATTGSNNSHVYGVGIIAVLAIGVCVFFAYNTFQPKKSSMKNKINPQNEFMSFKNLDCQKNIKKPIK